MKYCQQWFEPRLNNKKNLEGNRMDSQKPLMKCKHIQSHRRPNGHQNLNHYRRRRRHHTSRHLLHHKSIQKHFRLYQKLRCQQIELTRICLLQFVKHFRHYDFGQLDMTLRHYYNTHRHHMSHRHNQLDLHSHWLHQHHRRRQQLSLQHIENLD